MSPTADPFTMATGTYRNAARLGSRPMPLAAGEIAEFRRPRREWVRQLSMLGWSILGCAAFWIAVGCWAAVAAGGMR